jgi:hypothetical protein
MSYVQNLDDPCLLLLWVEVKGYFFLLSAFYLMK